MSNLTNPLQFEAKRVLKGAVQFDFEVEMSHFEIEDDQEFQFHKPVSGKLKATAAGGETVLVTIQLETTVSTKCVRCLDDIELPIKASIIQAWFVDPGQSQKSREDDEEKLYFDGNILDPTESLREEILVLLPSFPRCSPEKKPECTQDVNSSHWTFGDDGVKEVKEVTKETESWIGQLDSIKDKIKKD